jgi:hypothetical protein
MKHFFLVFFALCFFTLKTQAQAKWNCGEKGAANVVAVFDGVTQTLTISGVGNMGEDSPWENLKDAIKIVKINQGVTSIGQNAFGSVWESQCCYLNIETVIIANTVTRIGSNAFWGAVNLRKINIPNSVKVIEANAFSDTGLESISLPSSIDYIFDNAFSRCKSLKTANLSKTKIKFVYAYFKGCEKLEDVYFPKTVEKISYNVFDGCNSIKFVTCHNPTPPEIWLGPLSFKLGVFHLSQLTLFVPEASIVVYKYSDIWKDFGKVEAIPVR